MPYGIGPCAEADVTDTRLERKVPRVKPDIFSPDAIDGGESGMSRKILVRAMAGAAFLAVGWMGYTQSQTPPQLTMNKIKDDLYEIVGDGGNAVALGTEAADGSV